MSLRTQIEADNTEITTNTNDFGWPVTIIDPDGLSKSLVCYSADISQAIDPDTGVVVSGRSASIAISISSLTEAGFAGLPEGIADSSSKPWRVNFDDTALNSYTFKVRESNPDRTAGLVVCYLESYIA